MTGWCWTFVVTRGEEIAMATLTIFLPDGNHGFAAAG